jgi:hypothetical protein
MNVTPDLLEFDNGERVTAESWPRRRAELYDAIIPHEYGGLPDRGVCTEPVVLNKSVRRKDGVRLRSVEVRTQFADGREFTFPLKMWLPPGDDGPVPVILSGDGCWAYLDDDVGCRMIARGYAVAQFDRTHVVADIPDPFAATGIRRLFPDATFGALAAPGPGGIIVASTRCIRKLIRPSARASRRKVA